MGKFFSNGSKEEDKKDGLLRSLKNIEDKNEEQLKIIYNKNVNFHESFDLGKAYNEIEEMDKKVDY